MTKQPLSTLATGLFARAWYESVAFKRMWHPHTLNSTLRKRLTMGLFYLWAIYTLLLAVGWASETWVYWPITVSVFYILGRQHEAEFVRLLGIDPVEQKKRVSNGTDDSEGKE